MRVAGKNQAARVEDGNEQRGAYGQLFEIDVPAEGARRDRADRGIAGWRDAERALEGPEREPDPVVERDVRAVRIELEIADARVFELVVQHPRAQRAVVVEVRAEVDRLEPQHAQLQHVPGHRAAHGDRADDAVHAAPGIRTSQRRQLGRTDAGLQATQEMRPRVFVDDDVTGIDRHERRTAGIEQSLHDGLGVGRDAMRAAERNRRRRRRPPVAGRRGGNRRGRERIVAGAAPDFVALCEHLTVDAVVRAELATARGRRRVLGRRAVEARGCVVVAAAEHQPAARSWSRMRSRLSSRCRSRRAIAPAPSPCATAVAIASWSSHTSGM